jgi:hypothetical protein
MISGWIIERVEDAGSNYSVLEFIISSADISSSSFGVLIPQNYTECLGGNLNLGIEKILDLKNIL